MGNKVGTARGKFRADSSVKWENEKKMLEKKMEKSCAEAARERMMSRENHGDSLTDEVVEYYMGGRDGDAKNAAEYAKLMQDIKHGRIMADNPGNAAWLARREMMERQEQGQRAADELREREEAERLIRERKEKELELEEGKAAGNVADIARTQMMQRNLLKNRGKGLEQHPDVGQDKANRMAYPAR